MASQKALLAKGKIVDEIKSKIQDANTFVLFDYRGMSDAASKELRTALKENESFYKIYKNTLVRLALKDLGIDIDSYLEGPTAIAFSKDQISPIKVINDLSKKYDSIVFKVGVVDGEITEKDALSELAKIPSREGLYTMLAGGMIGIVKDLSIALDLYGKQLEEK